MAIEFKLLFPLISLLLLVVVAAAQQWLRWLVLRLCNHNHPPGPIPIPVLGNLLHLIGSPAPHRSLTQLARKYGPIFHLQLGVAPTVIVSTPYAAQQVLLAHDKSFAGRPDMVSFARLLYGLDMPSAAMSPYINDRWRSIRKFYSLHIFSARPHQEFHLPVVREEILRAVMGHVYAASRDGSPVNLSHLFSTLVQTILFRIVFHKHPPNLNTFAREAERLGSANRIGDFLPFLRFLDRSLDGAQDRCHRTMDAILEGVLTEREEAMKTDKLAPRGDDGRGKEQKENRNCILDVMLASDPPMERDEMKTMILELILAGTTTTASTLEWAMAELLNNEKVMRKAVEEVDAVMGTDGASSRMVSSEDVTTEKMPYIKAVVKETLRLHPPAPLLLPHRAAQTCDVKLLQHKNSKKTNSREDDDDGDDRSTCEVAYRIAAGTRVMVNAWAIGRDENTWGPTANQFFPERFLGVDREVDVRGHDFGLLPFGSGRRMCPGLMLAMSMLELTIATFLHCFDWKKSEEGPVDMSEDFGINLIRRTQLFALPTSFRLPSTPTTTPNGMHPDDQQANILCNLEPQDQCATLS